MRPLLRSFAARFVALFILVTAVPVILYGVFRDAERERNRILLNAVQEQGRTIAEGMRPILLTFDPRRAWALEESLRRLVGDSQTNVKALLAPAAGAPNSLFYVAAMPPRPAALLEREREELIAQRIIAQSHESCSGGRPLAARHKNPEGAAEILTSITPITTPAGCWLIVTSTSLEALTGSSVGRPYWQTREAQVAGAVYLVMATLVISLFVGAWRNVLGLRDLAQDIARDGGGDTFVRRNQIPELAGLAAAIDRMVDTLKASAELFREAAEEKTHAFKTPIAVIVQAIEPLERRVQAADTVTARSIELIRMAIARLESLVEEARRLETASADLMNPPHERVDPAPIISEVGERFGGPLWLRGVRIHMDLARGVVIRGGAAMIEGITENLIENAASFAPDGSTISVALRRERGQALLRVADNGPGVPSENLERIFERHFSSRPDPADGKHFGLGLWLVRRNAEALGGTAVAENRPGGGLAVTVRLPLA